MFAVLLCNWPWQAAAQSPKERAKLAASALQRWYDPQKGLYQTPTGWWNSANAITALVDYTRITGDQQYLSVVENTFRKANASYGITNYVNDSNDDEGWWAMAWIDAYDLTHREEYLHAAQVIFADLETQWETGTCKGGVWWSKDLVHQAYKNAVTNELFLQIGASLANRVKDAKQREEYLGWARKEWAWFQQSGIRNAEGLINDGLNAANPVACVNNRQTTWTYNQGVILGGLVELSRAEHDPKLLTAAGEIAHAVMAYLVTADGVLEEPQGSGPDWPQFKGVFMRNLARLNAVAPDAAYRRFAEGNAESIWRKDRRSDPAGGEQLGQFWQGPFDSADGTRQTSALDALLAALAMEKH